MTPSPFFRVLGMTLALASATHPAAAQDSLAGSYLAARVADLEGDYSDVVKYGTRALAGDTENQGLMEGLIMAEVNLGQFDAAVPVARRLAALDAGSSVAHLVLVADGLKREDWAGVEKLLSRDASLGTFLDQMIGGWTAVGAGHVNHAIELFDKMVDNPAIGDAALLQKALALALVGDYEGSAAIFGGDKGTLQLNRAAVIAYTEVLSQLERNPDAVALIDKVFPNTKDPELTSLRARLAAGEPVPFSAITSARDALAQLFYEVGRSLLDGNDPGLVLIYERLAQHLKPDHAGAAFVSAQVFEKLGKEDLAAAAFARVPETDRGYVNAQLGRATALRRMDKTDEALSVLDALAKARPELPAIESAIGDVYRLNQRYAEAVPHYTAAIALFKSDSASQWRTYFSRGIAFAHTDQWPKAEADFRKALELNPDQPSVLNYLGYSYVERRENLDEALDMIRRAVAARPSDGYIRDSLGWVYYRLGRYAESVDEMQRAVELNPLDPILNDHFGDALWAVGRTREAEFQWQRALSLVTDETDVNELNPDRIRRKLEVGLDKVLEEEGGEPIRK